MTEKAVLGKRFVIEKGYGFLVGPSTPGNPERAR